MKTTADDAQGCHEGCVAALAAFGESPSDKVLIYKTVFQGCQLSLPGTLRSWEPAAGNMPRRHNNWAPETVEIASEVTQPAPIAGATA
jgi:hypothetical protein